MTDTTTEAAEAPESTHPANVKLAGERPRYEPYPGTEIHPSAELVITGEASVTGSWDMQPYSRARVHGKGYGFANRLGEYVQMDVQANSSAMNCYLEERGHLNTYDSAQVSGARIHGFVQIGGRATIGERADLASYRHFLSVGPVGSEARTVTAWRVLEIPTGERAPFWSAMVRAGCFTGTLEQLSARIEDPVEGWAYKDGPISAWQADYRGFIAMAQERVAEWQLESPDEASVAFWTDHHPLAFAGRR